MDALNRQENVIVLPLVVSTVREGVHFTYNGTHGVHQRSGLSVYQFADEFDQDRIWVDAHGEFVCEE